MHHVCHQHAHEYLHCQNQELLHQLLQLWMLCHLQKIGIDERAFSSHHCSFISFIFRMSQWQSNITTNFSSSIRPYINFNSTPNMTSVQLWAPPHLSPSTIAQKVEEWMRANPTRPSFTRFLQDHLDSTWPSLWHLKTPFTIVLHQDSASGVDIQTDEPICAICHSVLQGGTEKMTCNHDFHTMCIHRWLQYSSTCPVCRAEL